MKQRLDISFDQEIVDKLQREKNYSGLVNEVVKNYYDAGSIENLQILNKNLQETKQIIKEKNKKKREIEAKIAKIKEKEAFILEKVKSRPALIKKIIEKRTLQNINNYRRIEYMITPEEEADNILKGGRAVT